MQCYTGTATFVLTSGEGEGSTGEVTRAILNDDRVLRFDLEADRTIFAVSLLEQETGQFRGSQVVQGKRTE